MTAISAYFASLGVRTDDASLKKVDAFLAKIENKLKQGVGKNGLTVAPKINTATFEKHLRGVLRNLGGGDKQKALRIRVQVSEQHLRKSIEATTVDKPVNAKVVAKLDKSSITLIKEQLKTALQDLTINARLGNVSGRAPRSSGGGRAPRTGGAYSWNPNPWGGSGNHLARWTEFMAGKPEKSSLSAANRRMSDVMMQSMFGGAPNTIRGMLGETLSGGIGRIGSSTMVGRGMGTLGHAIGGLRGGAVGLLGGAVVNSITKGMGMAWKGLGAVVSAPFKLVGSAANLVTSSFYRIALAAAPLVAGFAYINRTVQQSQQRQIALNTVSSSLGSSGKEESKWLMNMATREGLRYNTLIDPYTTFIASASPAMGLPVAKDIFESFTQFGLTRGANDVSMGLAMKAVSQMAG